MTTFDETKRRSWAGKAQAYAETFGPLCAHTIEQLLDAARVTGATELLDAGTGTGAVAAAALRRGARVTAVDPDADMRRLAAGAAPRAVVLAGALPALPLADASFDAVVANFVLNHVGDPRAAAAELARLARPGRWVAVSVWAPAASELHRLWDDVVADSGVPARPAPRLDPDKDFRRDADGVAELLAGAGLEVVQAQAVTIVHRVDPDVWWSGPARGVASIGAVVETQDPGGAARMRASYDRLSRRYLAADGYLELPTVAVVASGRAPDARGGC